MHAAHERFEGTELIDKVVDIDQSPIGRTPRSNPATHTKLFDLTVESKARGYRPGRLSFNVKGGRCEACAGDGQISPGSPRRFCCERRCGRAGGRTRGSLPPAYLGYACGRSPLRAPPIATRLTALAMKRPGSPG